MRAERFTRASLLALGGLLVWAAHFGVVYGLIGLACARGFAGALPVLVATASAAALATAGALVIIGWRRRGGAMLDWLVAPLAAFAMVAVVWQTLPIVMVPACT